MAHPFRIFHFNTLSSSAHSRIINFLGCLFYFRVSFINWTWRWRVSTRNAPASCSSTTWAIRNMPTSTTTSVKRYWHYLRWLSHSLLPFLLFFCVCLGSGSNWRIQSPRRGIHDNTNYVTFPSPILNCVCNLSLVTGEPASQRRHDNQHMIRPQSSCLFISLRILVHVNVIPEYLDLFVAWKVTLEIARAHLTRPSPHSPGSRKIRPRRCVCLVLSVGRRRRRDRTPNFSFCFIFFLRFSSSFSSLVDVCVCVYCRSRAGSLLSTLWSSSNNRIEITGSGVSDRKNWSESLPFRKNKKNFQFLLPFFPCLYFYMCVPAGGRGGGMRVTETIRYVSDCLPVELWLWIVSVRSWLPSVFCFLVAPCCRCCQAQNAETKNKTTGDWGLWNSLRILTFVCFLFLFSRFLQGAYPARLRKVLIVTAPLWFKAPFKILRLFVREKLRDRVYTVSLPQVFIWHIFLKKKFCFHSLLTLTSPYASVFVCVFFSNWREICRGQ